MVPPDFTPESWGELVAFPGEEILHAGAQPGSSATGREGFIEQLEQLARDAKAAGDHGAAVRAMIEAGKLRGWVQPAEPEPAQDDPEEQRRVIEQAARLMGMVYPKEIG